MRENKTEDDGNITFEITKGLPQISVVIEHGTIGTKIEIHIVGENLDDIAKKFKEITNFVYECKAKSARKSS